MNRLAALILALALLVLAGGSAAATSDLDAVGAWPLRPTPEVVAGFDPPGSTWGAGHRGVDLAGTPGQRVHAALPGTISFVGSIAGRGVVVVDHGETRTTYEPVTGAVRRGATVGRGAVIGTLDLPGSHCFPRACLHWGWLRGTTYLDPLLLVGAAPVRLLPLMGWPAGQTRQPAAPITAYSDWRPMIDLMGRAWAWR